MSLGIIPANVTVCKEYSDSSAIASNLALFIIA